MPDAPTLRSRRRAEMLGAIRAAAGRELVAHGAAALSLRAVAREVAMAPSALYRYFASRDDLLTDLVVSAFDAQADAVAAAAGEHPDPRDAIRAAMLAYRAWAVAHVAEFGLLYGAPVPGYVAPPSTIVAGARVGDLLVTLAGRLHTAGRTDPDRLRRRESALDATTAGELARLAQRRGYTLPLAVLATAVDGFVRVHGVTVMEVFGQLRPITSDPGPYVEQTVEAALSDLVGDP